MKFRTTTTALVLVAAAIAPLLFGIVSDAAASKGNTILNVRLEDDFASASATIVEGDIETEFFVEASTVKRGDTEIFLIMTQFDRSADEFILDIFTRGPADEVTIPSTLKSASVSGTVTGEDFVTGEEKTFTVDMDFSATGNREKVISSLHTKTGDINIVTKFNGVTRPASGSVDISGDGVTLSTDDLDDAIIATLRAGTLLVVKESQPVQGGSSSSNADDDTAAADDAVTPTTPNNNNNDEAEDEAAPEEEGEEVEEQVEEEDEET
jgi:hypothetical protein